MRIGNRYLGSEVLFAAFLYFVLLPTAQLSGFSPSASVFITLIATGILIYYIFMGRCPRCKKLLAAKPLEREKIGGSKERVTYSCVSCGKKWVKEERTWDA